jgi:hypothetical protein
MNKYTVNIKGNVHGMVQGDGRTLIMRGGKTFTICQVCDGGEACQWCGGDGEGQRHYSGAEYLYSDPCSSCNGSGVCVACGGEGEVEI